MNSLKTSLKFWRVMFQAKLRRDFESHRHNTYTRSSNWATARNDTHDTAVSDSATE
jgi:hypothetical protein